MVDSHLFRAATDDIQLRQTAFQLVNQAQTISHAFSKNKALVLEKKWKLLQEVTEMFWRGWLGICQH